MQDLYAVTFTLASESEEPALSVAVARTEAWLRLRVPDGVCLAELGAGELQNDATGATLRWAHRRSDDGGQEAVDAVLEHPDSQEEHDRWRAAVVITRDGHQERATVRVSRGTTRHELRPRPVRFAPPGIVPQLLSHPLHGYAGALEISTRSSRLRHDQVEAFVRDVLLNPNRVLPLVICDVGATAPDGPDELARRLAGLLHVVVLQSAEAWERVRDELPAAYVPYGGAALYWPGFEPRRNSRHRYFTRGELRGRSLSKRLDRFLRALAVQQVPRDRLPDRLRLQSFRSRATTSDVSTDQAEDPRDAELAALRQATADLDAWLAELERAEETIAELQETNERLASDLAISQSNVEQLTRFEASREADDPDDETESGAPEPPDQWGAAFEDALTDLTSPAMAFTPRAFACARRNSYRRPRDMYDALVALETLSRRYHETQGDLGGRLVEVARRTFGLSVSLQDNSYTSTQFEFEGQTLDRLPHVKVDDHTAPTEVGRIYFALDRENFRIVVDWFGVKDQRPTD